MAIMKEWLAQNADSLSMEDLFVTIHDDEANVVSMKASSVVPVTYKLIANVR